MTQSLLCGSVNQFTNLTRHHATKELKADGKTFMAVAASFVSPDGRDEERSSARRVR